MARSTSSSLRRGKPVSQVSKPVQTEEAKELSNSLLSFSSINYAGMKIKNLSKFHNWLSCGSADDMLSHIKFDRTCLETLSYLAYETVGHLVDLAMLVRREWSCPTDTIERALAEPVLVNPDFPSVQLGGCHRADQLNDSQQTSSSFNPLKESHVQEALRRLSQTPRSPFGWGPIADCHHQRCEQGIPLLAV